VGARDSAIDVFLGLGDLGSALAGGDLAGIDGKRCSATLLLPGCGQLAFAVAHIQGMSSSMRACGQPLTKRVSRSVR